MLQVRVEKGMLWGIIGIHQKTEYALSCTGVKSIIIVACASTTCKVSEAYQLAHLHREGGSFYP